MMVRIRVKKKMAIAALLGILGIVGGAIGYRAIFAPPFEVAWASAQVVQDMPAGDPIKLFGRVHDPDGSPAVGASVAVVSQYKTSFGDGKRRASTDSEGRFSIQLPRAELASHLASEQGVNLVATAPRRGMAWASAADFLSTADRDSLGILSRMTAQAPRAPILKLASDDPPFAGRALDAKGNPAAGVHISLNQIWSNDDGDLEPWATAVADGAEFGPATHKTLDRWLSGPGLEALTTTTDADGRFAMGGLGRGRLAALKVVGPTASCTTVLVRTDGGPALGVANLSNYIFPRAQGCLGGDEPIIKVSCSRPLEGAVRDVETGEPVVGATVQSHKFAGSNVIGNDAVSATTDSKGRFRLEGLTIGPDNMLLVRTPEQRPYLPGVADVDLAEGNEPLAVEIMLRRGVWADGRVTDATDGRPLLASIDYLVAPGNPNLAAYPHFRYLPGNGMMYRTNCEGRFRVPVMPGKGILAARVLGPSRWLPGGAKTSQAGRTFPRLGDRVQILGDVDPASGAYSSDPAALYTGNYHGVAPIEALDDEAVVTSDIKISH